MSELKIQIKVIMDFMEGLNDSDVELAFGIGSYKKPGWMYGDYDENTELDLSHEYLMVSEIDSLRLWKVDANQFVKTDAIKTGDRIIEKNLSLEWMELMAEKFGEKYYDFAQDGILRETKRLESEYVIQMEKLGKEQKDLIERRDRINFKFLDEKKRINELFEKIGNAPELE